MLNERDLELIGGVVTKAIEPVREEVKLSLIHIQRRKEGSYVGGPAPYGYQAVWECKVRRLIPDENTAEIVRYISYKYI